MTNKPKECIGCPLYTIGSGFVPLTLNNRGNTLLVGEMPTEEDVRNNRAFSGGAGVWLRNLMASAGQDFDLASKTNTISCYVGNVYPLDPKWTKTSYSDAHRAINHCAEAHLWPNVTRANKPKLYAIGAPALQALTGKERIGIWRGSPLPLKNDPTRPRVIGTMNPAALMRQAKLASVVVGDFKKPFILPPENYNLTPSLTDLRSFQSRRFAFDLEWGSDGEVTICGLSDRFYHALVVPWYGSYLDELRRIFESAEELIGHNIIQADIPYIERMGWDISRAKISDTMLKQHLVQPDYPHDLGFVASVFTNKVFWKGRGWEEEDADTTPSPTMQQWRTWDKPYALPRSLGGYGGCTSAKEAFALYNGRDTDGEFQINTPLSHLLTKYDIEGVYTHVSVPIAYIARDLSSHGLRINSSNLGKVREAIDNEITRLEASLPEGLAPYEAEVSCNLPAPAGTYKVKKKTCKGRGKKDAHDPWETIFTEPGEVTCPTCNRTVVAGKMEFAKIIRGTRFERVIPYNSASRLQRYIEGLGLKDVFDHKTGRKTTGKKARKIWGRQHVEFASLGALKQYVTLRNNFAKDSLLTEDRMYFNLKVHGTSEGRLSSSGKREGIDLNVQNQPKKFRSIYIPDRDDWGFLDLDIVQGENMLTTWLAKDWERWERINAPGYDEHCDLASRIFGRIITKSIEDDPCRQVGKKINHGRNYGMGIKKQHEEMIVAGFEQFTQADVKEFIEIWKQMNSRTAQWQIETIAEAEKRGYLRNPFGRKRWFSSRDMGTKALAFLPASTLADMVLRMMIAHYPSHPKIGPSIKPLGLDVYMDLIRDWIMSIQVHDSIVLQGPQSTWRNQAERSQMIMQQPWKELDGFRFRAEVKYSPTSWGECKEVKIN